MLGHHSQFQFTDKELTKPFRLSWLGALVIRLIVVLALVWVLASVASGATTVDGASSLIASLDDPKEFDFMNNTTIGYSFITGPSVVAVTHLGFWSASNSSFASDVDIGLYSQTELLLGGLTLPAGEELSSKNGFLYAPLPGEVHLQPLTEYAIGGFRQFGVPYSANDTTEGRDFKVIAGFDIVEERAGSDQGGEPSIVFPGLAYQQDQALIGPNLLFRVIPEPSTTFLLGCSMGWLAMRRRRD